MEQAVVHDFRFASFLRKAKKWQSVKSKRIGGGGGGGVETCKLETLYISLSPSTFVCNRVWMMVFRMEIADDVLLSELAINHQLQYSEDTYLLAHLDPKPSYHHHTQNGRNRNWRKPFMSDDIQSSWNLKGPRDRRKII